MHVHTNIYLHTLLTHTLYTYTHTYVHAYICTYIHTCTHTIHTHIHMHTYIHAHTYFRLPMEREKSTWIHAEIQKEKFWFLAVMARMTRCNAKLNNFTYICMYVCICTHARMVKQKQVFLIPAVMARIYILLRRVIFCMYVYMYVCMYVYYIYTHTLLLYTVHNDVRLCMYAE